MSFSRCFYYAALVFDRWKGLKLIQELSYSVDDDGFGSGLTKSGSNVLACTIFNGGVYFYLYFVYTCSLFDRGKGFDSSISVTYYIGKFVHKLISEHGFELASLLCASLVLVKSSTTVICSTIREK